MFNDQRSIKKGEKKKNKNLPVSLSEMRTFTERELTSSDEGDIVDLIVLTCRLARNSDELVSMPGNQTGISAADGNWPSYQCQSRNWKSARRFCYKRLAVLTGRRKILRRCNSIITIADGTRLPYDPGPPKKMEEIIISRATGRSVSVYDKRCAKPSHIRL